MRPSEVLEKNREAIRRLVASRKATNPRVFGSVARGEDRDDSDLDILVDTLEETTLFDLGGLLIDLQNALPETEVHLLTPGDFPVSMRGQVLQEALPI
ncbi:nucleotidyltransferase family protein [Rhizobium sp. SAFR-030]|uniref:nucleotidyltransferase family protein n=1 Tax=Rhizobium sp. SAFR-030 TaxID=3387277 RepID=UPI003F80C985